MTGEQVKKWLVALFSNDSTIRSLVGSPSTFGPFSDTGARPGVFVDLTDDSREQRWVDEIAVRIVGYVTTGEQAAFTLASRIEAILRAEPGEALLFGLFPPSAYGLKFWSVRRDSFVPPEKDGPSSSGYRVVFVYVFRARKTSLPA